VVAEHPRAGSPRLLVLGAGPAQLGLLEAARDRGVYVVAADRDPAARGFELADDRALVSTEDEPGIERLARARHVDGIVSPGADWAVGVAARVAERIGLQHPLDAATGSLVTSKLRQRERFAAAGVPHASAASAEAPALPCVVKAADRQGQRGLTLVRSREELPAALALAAAESRVGSVLVEELVDGPEVTVNAVSFGGEFTPLTVTDRVVAEAPAFGVALAHVWPSEHNVAEAVTAARDAADALGVRAGPSYTQVRLSRNGPRVMELAARLGGGHDAELCQAATGVDLNGLAIDFALGRGGSMPARPRGDRSATAGLSPNRRGGDRPLRDLSPDVGGACVLFLVAPPGILCAVDGLEAARALPGIRWVRAYRRPGWRFPPLRRGADRAGAVLAVGDSRGEALQRARRAAEAVRFEVDVDAA
jgi:biotin carboxylase